MTCPFVRRLGCYGTSNPSTRSTGPPWVAPGVCSLRCFFGGSLPRPSGWPSQGLQMAGHPVGGNPHSDPRQAKKNQMLEVCLKYSLENDYCTSVWYDVSLIFDLEIRHGNESIVENREGHRLLIQEAALRSKVLVSRIIKHPIKDLTHFRLSSQILALKVQLYVYKI